MTPLAAQRSHTLASVQFGGQTVSIRDLAELQRFDRVGSGATVFAATLASAAASGATSVSIEVDDGGAKNLKGRLPKSLPVVVDGQSHTLASTVFQRQAQTSVDLTLSAGLTSSVSAGAAVTWSPYVEAQATSGSTSIPAVHGHVRFRRDDQSQGSTVEVMIPKDATSWVPEPGAEVWDGSEFLGVYEDDAGSDAIAWRFLLEATRR